MPDGSELSGVPTGYGVFGVVAVGVGVVVVGVGVVVVGGVLGVVLDGVFGGVPRGVPAVGEVGVADAVGVSVGVTAIPSPFTNV